jgi:hypothetical protein
MCIVSEHRNSTYYGLGIAPKWTIQSYNCPFGAQNCHISSGKAFFPEFGVSIKFTMLYSWSGRRPRSVLEDMQSFDVVVATFGLHYKTRGKFDSDMDKFAATLKRFKRHGFFIEHFPSHIQGDKVCEPMLDNVSHYRKTDQRTELSYFENLENITVIRIAEAMISQFNAHIGGDSQRQNFYVSDCVHYCANSGVFKFLRTTIFNYLVKYKLKD